MRRGGFSVAEALLGLGLLSLLMTVVFVAFEKGAQCWRRVDRTRDLVEGSRMVAESLEKEVQRSCYASLSIQGQALSLASALDGQGQFLVDAQGAPTWSHYVIFYRDPQSSSLIRCEERFTHPQPSVLPLETALGVSLASRLKPGRRLAEQVEALELAVVDQRLDYRLRCLRPATGRQPATPFTLEGSCRFRNR